MLTQIDHVVVVVPNLETAVHSAESAGFTVVPGGSHAGGVTHNALIIFRDGTYIELIAFLVEPEDQHYFSKRHRLGSGLAEFALLSTNLAEDVAAIQRRGVPFPPPTHLGRERPDGVRLNWRMSLPATVHPERGFPFLIEDTTNRSLRVPSSARETTHANGAIGVAGVSVVVSDLETAAPEYRAILDAPPDRTTVVGLAGKGILKLPLQANHGQWIALMQTFPGSVPEAYLNRFGEGPYAVNLLAEGQTDAQPGDGSLIDPALMAGARFYL